MQRATGDNAHVRLSVVVPVHNEADVLSRFLERLVAVLESLEGGWEVVFVEDSSTDRTWQMVREAAARDTRIRGLRLSRGFGHQGALTAGTSTAKGDLVITMDGDLQHPPETIPQLVTKTEQGYDVVYAVRSPIDSERRGTILRAHAFYWVLNHLARLDLPDGVADFRCMSRPVVDALVSMPERSRFLRGMTRWVGFRQTVVEYNRAPRAGGRSKYTVGPMLRLALDAVISFSTLPLRVASILGIIVSLIGAAYGGVIVIQRLVGDVVVPGYTSLLVTVLLLGGVQLACIGIIGEYLGRVYEESKARPLFLVWEDTRQPIVEEPAGLEADARLADRP
jgi:glycosyltransferase involved in cell wall biosynthesis